jgi:serine protease Do
VSDLTEIEPKQKEPIIKNIREIFLANRILIISIAILLIGIIGGLLGSYLYQQYFASTQGRSPFTTTTINVKENSSVVTTSKKAMPAVVSITGVTQTVNLFGQKSNSEIAGTGYVVQSDGVIVTNKHVASSASAKYSVIMSDGKTYPAVVKALDPMFDIAILKVEARNLPVLELGSSDSLQAGQTAIAIGNALGQYQNSVTVGVISGIGRVIEASDSTGASTESLDNVIQTDAAINSGNSGGPLLNIAGQVIGMNTAVDSQGQGIGFALPVNLIKSALESYSTKGKIVRAMLGVRYVSLTKDVATQNNLPVSEGAYIFSNSALSAVVAGSPASKAGLKSGDIITKIGDDKITPTGSLISLLSKHTPQETVKITWLRDGKTLTANVQLSENQ